MNTLKFDDGFAVATEELEVIRVCDDASKFINTLALTKDNMSEATLESLVITLDTTPGMITKLVSLEEDGKLKAAYNAIKKVIKKMYEWLKKGFQKLMDMVFKTSDVYITNIKEYGKCTLSEKDVKAYLNKKSDHLKSMIQQIDDGKVAFSTLVFIEEKVSNGEKLIRVTDDTIETIADFDADVTKVNLDAVTIYKISGITEAPFDPSLFDSEMFDIKKQQTHVKELKKSLIRSMEQMQSLLEDGETNYNTYIKKLTIARMTAKSYQSIRQLLKVILDAKQICVDVDNAIQK